MTNFILKPKGRKPSQVDEADITYTAEIFIDEHQKIADISYTSTNTLSDEVQNILMNRGLVTEDQLNGNSFAGRANIVICTSHPFYEDAPDIKNSIGFFESKNKNRIVYSIFLNDIPGVFKLDIQPDITKLSIIENNEIIYTNKAVILYYPNLFTTEEFIEDTQDLFATSDMLEIKGKIKDLSFIKNIFWNTLNKQLEDPFLQEGESIQGEVPMSLTEEMQRELESAIRLAFWGTPEVIKNIDRPIEVCIRSVDQGTYDEEEDILQYIPENLPEKLTVDFQEMMGKIVEKYEFHGVYSEYNDGAYNRLSGYGLYNDGITFNIPVPSEKEKVQATTALKKWILESL